MTTVVTSSNPARAEPESPPTATAVTEPELPDIAAAEEMHPSSRDCASVTLDAVTVMEHVAIAVALPVDPLAARMMAEPPAPEAANGPASVSGVEGWADGVTPDPPLTATKMTPAVPEVDDPPPRAPGSSQLDSTPLWMMVVGSNCRNDVQVTVAEADPVRPLVPMTTGGPVPEVAASARGPEPTSRFAPEIPMPPEPDTAVPVTSPEDPDTAWATTMHSVCSWPLITTRVRCTSNAQLADATALPVLPLPPTTAALPPEPAMDFCDAVPMATGPLPPKVPVYASPAVPPVAEPLTAPDVPD